MQLGNLLQCAMKCTSQLIIKCDYAWHDVTWQERSWNPARVPEASEFIQAKSPPEFSFASTAESPLHKTTVHSFSTDRDEPCAPTLLMLPMPIVQIAPAQNQADPSAE